MWTYIIYFGKLDCKIKLFLAQPSYKKTNIFLTFDIGSTILLPSIILNNEPKFNGLLWKHFYI